MNSNNTSLHTDISTNHQPPTTNHPSPSTIHLPTHIAIIMDGNGRWAEAKGLPRTAGHKKGAESLRTTLAACRDANVRFLTVYAFSSENWKRPASEIFDLMQLLKLYLTREIKELHKHGTKLQFIGDRGLLDADIQKIIADAEKLTADNAQFFLTIALSYGSRQEITRAVRQLTEAVKSGELQSETIMEDHITAALDTRNLPDPDLLIRTGGEQRLSNFLLWQSAYTELYFTDTLWPAFGTDDFKAALNAYSQRERRYGNTHA